MSERIDIKSSEQGVLRVFAVDLEGEALAAFTRRNGDWPVQKALGAKTLTPERVEIFPVSDLEGVGLSGYLEDGQGVAPGELDGLRGQLDAVTGTVMVLPSSAFAGSAQTLTPRAPLRLIATLNEERPPVRFDPLPSEAAMGIVTPPVEPAPAGPTRRALTLLALIALAIFLIGIAVMVAL